MLYIGIDYHKRYSVVSTQAATGARVCEARIDDNDPAAFAAYFKNLPEPSRVVLVACWNWAGSMTNSARSSASRTWCSRTGDKHTCFINAAFATQL